jgi:hypothetical protein
MRLPSGIAAGSVAIAVFAGGFSVGHFVTDDSGSSKTKAVGKPKVLGQVFARNPDTSSSTTAVTLTPVSPPGTNAPSPAATSTTAAGGQSTTNTTAQVTITSPPATTPATVVVSGDCGTGTADAAVSATTFPRNKTANTDYETDATVNVNNRIDKPIQIDALSIRLTYEDGGVQDVSFNNAIGNIVQPGNTAQYRVALNTGQRPVHTVNLQTFGFHTQGHPECTGRPA